MVIVLESVAVGISEPAFLLCGVKGGVCRGSSVCILLMAKPY